MEYITASEAVCDLVWLTDLLVDANLLEEESSQLQTSKLQINSKGAVDMIRAEALIRHFCHIEIHHHLIWDWMDKGIITIEHIADTTNSADRLIKALGPELYGGFVDAIGIKAPDTGVTA